MISRAVLAVVAAVASCIALTAGPQGKPSATPEGFPFSVWLSHKEVTQIPWRLDVTRPSVRYDLRHEVVIAASIPPSEFEKDKDLDLVLYMRALQGGRTVGPVFAVSERNQPRSTLPAEVRGARGPLIPYSVLASIRVPAIMQPGRYKIEVALLDRGSGRYNTRYVDIAIPGNPNDSLERILASGAERVQFLQMPRPGVRVPQPVDIQAINPFGPSIVTFGGGVLRGSDSGGIAPPAPRIRIERPGALKLSVISVLSPPDKRTEEGITLGPFQSNLLSILALLVRLDVQQGSSDLTTIDLSDGSRLYDRTDLKGVSLVRLRQALAKDRTGVSLTDLQRIASSGQYFRDLLAKRLREAELDSSGATHSIIIAGARTEFPDGSKLTPIPAARDCHCKVFYLRFALMPNEKDHIPKLLSAYSPRVYEPLDWSDFRNHIATIYEKLRQ